MAFVRIPFTAAVRITYLMGDTYMTNNINYVKAGGWSALNFNDLAAGIFGVIDAYLVAHISDQMAVTELKLTNLNSSTGIVRIYTPASPLIGELETDPLPFQTALVATLNTDLRGRSYRGRVYTPGATEEVSEGRNAISGHVTAIQTFWDAMNPGPGVTGTELVVVSRYENGVARAEGVATPVTSITVNPRWDTQRRRQY